MLSRQPPLRKTGPPVLGLCGFSNCNYRNKNPELMREHRASKHPEVHFCAGGGCMFFADEWGKIMAHRTAQGCEELPAPALVSPPTAKLVRARERGRSGAPISSPPPRRPNPTIPQEHRLFAPTGAEGVLQGRGGREDGIAPEVSERNEHASEGSTRAKRSLRRCCASEKSKESARANRAREKLERASE
jgi:hypothetical protein